MTTKSEPASATAATSTLMIGDRPMNRLGFGAMRLTDWTAPSGTERERSIAVARRAVELGVTLFDTADSYALGGNEELIADALHPYPDQLMVATKAGQSRPGGAWVPLGRPEYLKQQAELSLRRLRLDVLELFQLHRVDPQVPLADQIGALSELRDEGKIRHIGLSEVSLDQLRAAQQIAPIASVQNLYNLYDRQHDEVLDYCEAQQVAFLAWLPIAGGQRSGRHDPVLNDVADASGATTTQVALAWLLARSPVMMPIPGTSSIDHLEDNVAAATVRLDAAQYDQLSAIRSAP